MKRTTTLQLLITVLMSMPALAQTDHTLAIYGIASQITGTVGVGSFETDVSVDVDTIFDNLEMAGMAHYRAAGTRWSFAADAVFLGLGAGKDGTLVDIDLTIVDANVAYRFNEVVEAFAGVRYTDLSASVETTRPVSGEAVFVDNGDEFFDPVVGLRFVTPLSQEWLLQGQGDIGGFGVAMDFQWEAMLNIGYRPSESWSFWLGYRALDQDFEDAGADDRFDMNVTYHGPQVGVAWHF